MRKYILISIIILLIVSSLGCISNGKEAIQNITKTTSTSGSMHIGNFTRPSTSIITTSVSHSSVPKSVILSRNEIITVTRVDEFFIGPERVTTVLVTLVDDNLAVTNTVIDEKVIGQNENDEPIIIRILNVYGQSNGTWSVIANFPGNTYFWTGNLVVYNTMMKGTFTLSDTKVIIVARY